ncbi:MAG: N-6 DNA methylase [Candidatus Diapherotrites archaeon]|nr:N-6 DNA methylase [Candidatus Diapherotrites archaeon]
MTEKEQLAGEPLFNKLVVEFQLRSFDRPLHSFGKEQKTEYELFKSTVLDDLPEVLMGDIGKENPTVIAQYLSGTEENVKNKVIEPLLCQFLGFKKKQFQYEPAVRMEDGTGHIDIVINVDPKYKILVETKSWRTDLNKRVGKYKKSAIVQAFEYAEAHGINWVVVTNGYELRLYNRKEGSTKYEKFLLDDLNNPLAVGRTSAFHPKRVYTLLSNESFVSRIQDKILEQSEEHLNDLGEYIYEVIKELRNELANNILRKDKQIIQRYMESSGLTEKQSNQLVLDIIQTFIDRLIFIRFAEGRGLLPEPYDANFTAHLKELWQTARADIPDLTFFDYLRKLFRKIDEGNFKDPNRRFFGYNGGLFAPNTILDNPHFQIDDHVVWDVILRLNKYAPKKKTKKIKHLMLEKNEKINFSEVPVEVLGHIYEKYLGLSIDLDWKSIHPKVIIDETKEKRKEAGVYYTPKHITEYIVKNTVGSFLKENLDRLDNINVVDPACGSGTFLLSAYEYLFDNQIETTALSDKSLKSYVVRIKKLIKILSQRDTAIKDKEKLAEKVGLSLFEINNTIQDLLGKNILLISPDGYYRLSPKMYDKEMINEDLLTQYLKSKLRFLALDMVTNKKKVHINEHILKTNLHGVDLQSRAVEITKLSLWLKTAIKNAKLINLGTQILEGNSLITGVEGPEELKQFKTELNEIIKLEEHLESLDETKESHQKIRKLVNEIKSDKKELVELLDKNLVKEDDEGYFDNIKNIKPFDWEVEFPTVFDDGNNPGFDVVIGNPPYSAKLSKAERGYIRDTYPATKGNTDTAIAFINHAYTLLKKGGYLGFIVPKSLLYSDTWVACREFILPDLVKLVDVSKAFEGVRLEQVIIILKKGSASKTYAIEFLGSTKHHEIKKSNLKKFGIILNEIGQDELKLGLNLSGKARLSDVADLERGLGLQDELSQTGSKRIYGGSSVGRFLLKPTDRFISSTTYAKHANKLRVQETPKVIMQNIVAHVTKPKDHLLFISTFDYEGILTLDTVVNISPKADFDPFVLVGILNSKLFSWYAYRFIYAKAIRNMHFDKCHLNKSPLCKLPINKRVYNRLRSLVDECCTIGKNGQIPKNLEEEWSTKEKEINELVYEAYGLGREDSKIIERSFR